MHVERSARCMDIEMNVIPAYAGIQIRGAAWIPACAGMTTTLRAQYVDTPEYITRSRGVPCAYEPCDNSRAGRVN